MSNSRPEGYTDRDLHDMEKEKDRNTTQQPVEHTWRDGHGDVVKQSDLYDECPSCQSKEEDLNILRERLIERDVQKSVECAECKTSFFVGPKDLICADCARGLGCSMQQETSEVSRDALMVAIYVGYERPFKKRLRLAKDICEDIASELAGRFDIRRRG
jgi:DNA-directed RNA polymerase subunit M/transcription elongation factor TFIIS